MKKIKSTIAVLVLTLTIFLPQDAISQAPEKMSYQSVIRNTTGDLVTEGLVGIQISILQGSAVGAAAYIEAHSVTTNVNGLVSLELGMGTMIMGTFTGIDWGNGPYFVKSDIDPSGGSAYSMSATSELLSVPYAIHASTSGDNQWSESGSGINTSNFSVGINSGNPLHTLDVRSLSTSDAAGLNVSNDDRSRYVRFFSGSEMFPDPSMSWAPDRSLLFATYDDNTFDFQEKMRITSQGDVGIGVNDPEAKLDILGGDWNLDAGNPGDLRIGNETYNFRVGVATGGGGAGIARLYTNSSALILGANDTPSLILEADGRITAPALSDSLIALGGERSLVTKEYADIKYVSGLVAIDEGNGVGYRLIDRDSTYYGNIGVEAVDISYSSLPSTELGATGIESTAMGSSTTASGLRSIAMGAATEASGAFATAMGVGTEASGDFSTAMGNGTIASSDGSSAMGRNTTASGYISTAMGDETSASGWYSTAMGRGTTASNFYSTAIGGYTTASGNYSTAMGVGTTASGPISTAMGSGTTTLGYNSTAMGHATVAPSYSETVIGSYNTSYTPVSEAVWKANDRLFVVGNGSDPSFRSNALTVLKNGNIGVVTATPQARLHISYGNDTGLGNNNGYLLLGETSGTNISIDNNEIMARNNGVAADLSLQIDGGNLKIGGTVFIGDETIRDAGNNALRINAALIPDVDNTNVLGNPTQRWTTLYATNGTINTSDRREKKNIEALDYGLDEVLQMQPVSFNWKNENSPDLKLGLIAQDLMTLIPEVVKSHCWEIDESTDQLARKELDRLGVYYSDLVPVLIKAIQEQQKMIEGQEVLIDELKEEDSTQKEMIDELKEQNTAQAKALNSNTTLMKDMQSMLNQQSQK